MEKLSYKTLENVGYDVYLLKDAKEKVLQFGEGNFLSAFLDYCFDLEKNVMITESFQVSVVV